MGVEFQDYYKTLGVERGASQSEISKAYRKLARKYHPDVNKDPDSEDRFKEINEANEVLGDAEKRARYDALGANWKAGQDFRPPPGYEDILGGFGGGSGGGFRFQTSGANGGGSFSDFFDMLFGGAGGASFGGSGFGGAGSSFDFGAGQAKKKQGWNGSDMRASMTVSLDDAYHMRSKSVTFDVLNEHGAPSGQQKKFQVKIPGGLHSGKTIRLTGQGGKGIQGGKDGDLLITVSIAPDPRFKRKGDDLFTSVKVAPWEAALGAKVPVQTLDGKLSVSIPAGSDSGKRLRLRGKGMPKKDKTRGDLMVSVEISSPKSLTADEKELFEELKKKSSFNPRG